MTRLLIDPERIHPAIRERVSGWHRRIVEEVDAATARHPLVVVGMRLNPACRQARRLLDGIGLGHEYLEYGGYLDNWRRRNALKMWTGWPTFPMVFVKGQLIGGAEDLGKLIDSGELQRMLA